jgi:peptide methionine sulfoxide reductase msrA/msrB
MILKTKSLTPSAIKIIVDAGTEHPFSGAYNNERKTGTYLCRQCGLALFRADNKFDSSCGWPSFDKEISDNILYKPDPDGSRTEILCSRCEGHMGHVFKGEGLTKLNTRHCVNSESLDFVENESVLDTEEAIVAGGCFWGIEHLFHKLPGVLKAESGYIGGTTKEPTYEDISTGSTGHYEAVRVLYDPSIINYESIIKYFFEIHDPHQENGQGPDIGQQYMSVCFYYNDEQKSTCLDLIKILQSKYGKVATKLLEVSTFWKAEFYHQRYNTVKAQEPYCHVHQKKF